MKPVIRHISPEEFLSTGWDGGITRQIAIGPEHAVYAERNFLWRISSASVELEESDFTPLPAYERYISVLNGRMELNHESGEAKILMPGEIYKFDGGRHTHSKGTCTDFNLMLRKGACTGSLARLLLAEGEERGLPAAPGEQILLFCTEGHGVLSDGNVSGSFEEGEALLLTQGSRPFICCEKKSAYLIAKMKS